MLGPGADVAGAPGRRLLSDELAHVVQYDLSGLGRCWPARHHLGASPTRGQLSSSPSVPRPWRLSSSTRETPLPGGLGCGYAVPGEESVTTPIGLLPAYEAKWPGPGEVGLARTHRWHLAGPDATGGEIGIAYAPENFNVSRTATVENVLRSGRAYMRAVGGDLYFDFSADCLIVGEHEGASIRVVENVHWQIDGRLFGSDNIIQILDEHVVVPPMPPVTPAAPTPSPAQSMQGPGTAGPEPTSTTPTPNPPRRRSV